MLRWNSVMWCDVHASICMCKCVCFGVRLCSSVYVRMCRYISVSMFLCALFLTPYSPWHLSSPTCNQSSLFLSSCIATRLWSPLLELWLDFACLPCWNNHCACGIRSSDGLSCYLHCLSCSIVCYSLCLSNNCWKIRFMGFTFWWTILYSSLQMWFTRSPLSQPFFIPSWYLLIACLQYVSPPPPPWAPMFHRLDSPLLDAYSN